MFGHSMGVVIVRNDVTLYGNGISGVTLCGITGIFPNLKQLSQQLKQRIDQGDGNVVDDQYLEK